MELNWPKLVGERNEWIVRNFPNPTIPDPGESLLGMIEELGELAHAHLKKEQAIRGDSARHDADAKDAIADLTIYLLGVMSKWDWTPSISPPHDRLDRENGEKCIFALSRHISGLVWSYETGMTQNYTATDMIVFYCKAYCVSQGWDYEKIVQETWDKVKQRDWIKYPETGLPT